MYDSYYLKIEVDYPGQMKLIDLLLGVEHDYEEGNVWVFSMDYDETFGDLPLYYISNFMMTLDGKFEDLEKLGITRDKISIWRSLIDTKDVFMEYAPEEMEMMSKAGIKFRIICTTLDEEYQDEILPGKHILPHC